MHFIFDDLNQCIVERELLKLSREAIEIMLYGFRTGVEEVRIRKQNRMLKSSHLGEVAQPYYILSSSAQVR